MCSHPDQNPPNNAMKKLRPHKWHSWDWSPALWNSHFMVFPNLSWNQEDQGPLLWRKKSVLQRRAWSGYKASEVGCPKRCLQALERRLVNWCSTRLPLWAQSRRTAPQNPASGGWLRKTNHSKKTSSRKSYKAAKRPLSELRKHLTQELLSSAHEKAF